MSGPVNLATQHSFYRRSHKIGLINIKRHWHFGLIFGAFRTTICVKGESFQHDCIWEYVNPGRPN